MTEISISDQKPMGVCKKAYQLSILADKSILEILLISSSILHVFVLIIDSELLYIANFAILFSIVMTWNDASTKKKSNYFPFKLLLLTSVIVQLIGFLLKFLSFLYANEGFDELIVTRILLTIGVVLYLFLAILFILAALNLLFYVSLKLFFPSETDYQEAISVRKEYLTLKEFSKHTTINEQIIFAIAVFCSASIIALIPIFGPSIFFTFIDRPDLAINNFFIPIDYGWFTLANTIAIVALLITFLNITIPIHNKIRHSAYEKYKKSLDRK
ncbi:hypothetical protein [Planococcus sp. ISL-109]|uniref:hypothetical protein n=1 Tax=Planococcus sp. ISL-109 TaxID=2819166 RepID=UPI001BEBE42E|nr:hypothetical protein [Planococcus sp. ISL-109]MBT2584210.1 hypothetical protein [Planococcus sp. ISL-109]